MKYINFPSIINSCYLYPITKNEIVYTINELMYFTLKDNIDFKTITKV